MIDSKIIKIASNTKFYGLKNVFTHKANIKNKQCGDIITIELVVKKSIIHEMRYETESCVFCQASASLLANKINLFGIKNIKKDINMLCKSLINKNIKLPKKFSTYKILINNKNISRFDCIMLPFSGLIKALSI